MVEEESNKIGGKKRVNGSIRSIFMHADRMDVWLMAFGFLGAIVEGFIDRIRFLFASEMFNSIANVSKMDSNVLRDNLSKNALLMLCSGCLTFVACFIEGYCWTRTGERQAARMRATYLKALLRQELGYFDLQGTSTSDVVTSISNDSLMIQDVISEKVPNMVSKFASFVGGYLVAFLLVWQLALVALPLALVTVLPGRLCGRSLIDLSAKMRREYNKASMVAEQAISSIRTVYAFSGEKKTLTEFSGALKGYTKLGLRQGLVNGFAIGSGATTLATWSLICYYGSRLVMYHGAHSGAVYFAGLAIVLGGLSLSAGLSHLKDIMDACYVSKRAMEVIKRSPKIDSQDTKGIILDNFSAEIKFKQVQFSYPSRPESLVLNNFSLTIPEGKTVALVGPSGSGKSTVLSLLQRFYDPLEGEILLDGVAIENLQVKWLRSQMALVSQEPALLSTSIKENILYGKEDATMEEILEACKASDAHNFITQLPQGYDTQVGERGVQLSGGQKQRIAIARAIIRKPRILLLDEATSALDSESERYVQEAIDKVVVGRSTIVIAHRLSTIKGANIIAVVENGHVVEIGSHEELMQEQNGMYNLLIRLQQVDKQEKVEECNSLEPSTTKDLNDIKNDYVLEASKSYNVNSSNLIPTSPTANNGISEHLKTPQPSFWKLIALSRPEWKQGCLGCFSSILVGAIQPFYAIAMGTTLSVYFLPNHDEIKEWIRYLALWFLLLSVLSLTLHVCQHYSFAYIGECLAKRLREKMLSKILSFEVGWFDKEENSTGLICSRLTKDANVVKSLVADKISFLIEAISVVIISWSMGLVIAWRLAIVSIAAQPLIIVCFYVKRVLLKQMCRKAMKAENESTKLAVEAMSNFRTVTAFSCQERILKMVEMAQEGIRDESIRQSRYAGLSLGCCLFIINCNWSLNFWYGGKLVSEGYTSPRAIFQSLIILLSMSHILIEAGITITIFAKAWESIQSIFSTLDRDTRIEPQNPKGYNPEKITGNIELCNVSFAYPTRPNVMVFQGFSLFVEAGKSVALVGKSGSGKSTVIALIERFYDPLEGAVKVDGLDIRSFNLRSLRNHIALVNQEPILFAGSIRENITYGLLNNIAEAEIIEAARAANIHDFIKRQQDGYATMCGDKGLQLSGGQKQRIAIARAILRNPRVLLLDEATSALDSHSEKAVHEALEHMMKGRTSIVIAHRLHTIRNCDEIIMLDNGKVVEKGSHLSLMNKGPMGAYHSLVSLQMAE